MSITAADIRREVKEKKCYLYSVLIFSDILGTMKCGNSTTDEKRQGLIQ